MKARFAKIIAFINKKVHFFTDKYQILLLYLFKFKFVKVNKEKFIRKVVKRFFIENENEMVERALNTSLSEILTEQQKKKYYRRMLWNYGSMVFFVSFTLTLSPEDLLYSIISGALDIIFFQCALYIVMQKIMFLYGKGDDARREETKNIKRLVAIDSSGLMIGKHPLLQKLKSVSGTASKWCVKKFGPQAVSKLSKSAFIILRRQGIKWGGIIVTRENVDVVFNAIIPLTCALISGLVSVVIFIPMCNKLRNHLIRINEK